MSGSVKRGHGFTKQTDVALRGSLNSGACDSQSDGGSNEDQLFGEHGDGCGEIWAWVGRLRADERASYKTAYTSFMNGLAFGI
jgi:hypothetical protein